MDWSLILENGLKALVGTDAVVFALAAIGLNVHFGYTGLVNFGQVAFLAMGAYGIAMGVVTFGLSMWLAIFLGLFAAVVLAVLLGLPTLRLRSDYLAIVTIAAGEIVRLVLRSASLRGTTGGSDGLQAFADPFFDINPLPGRGDGVAFGPIHLGEGGYGLFNITFGPNTTWVLIVGWTLVGLTSLMVWALMRSPWGRIVKSIREDEEAVRSLGKNVNWYKMQSLILGGVIGAIGGVIFAISRQSVQPDNYSTALTFFAYTALILGGTARIFGPIVGSMLFWSLLSFTDVTLRQAVANDLIPGDFLTGTRVGILRFILVGLGLILLMVFRPQGIFGDKKEVAIGERG
ncbi:branched-chain amino acid ABC transporter permease [Iamia sp. SCSIO 61187]|uniref:branched-chain amino acid ABC transporter permease n=1 Tax=Iamia sp. SCSIO 61187 TaxID=2722752 RepID=UPI001C629C8F|nr:branched-chain amino acid ABC transporter permease [Iamia sp. SCSIO 61187]QYG91666.1 branched-chain amino acid ABC transporter permease [Iamia sp. SCSIO 61187]